MKARKPMTDDELKFWQEVRWPRGKELLQRAAMLGGCLFAWTIVTLAWPEVEHDAHTFFVMVTVGTAFWLGVSCGWVDGFKETWRWLKNEPAPMPDDDPFARDPEVWMTTGSVNDQ